jgi:DNA-binding HxlR family transcriptional regulator
METMDRAESRELTRFCPAYHRAVELIGRRWTGAILRALLTDVRRFNDLAAVVPGLSDRMLAERLRELEAEDVVVRTVIPESPVRVEYSLTRKGRDLEVVVRAVAGWADTWVSKEDCADSVVAESATGQTPIKA